ncbi:MAG: sugar phosphate isomerase/epimerase family protein [Halobacteriales archaeon]
MYTLSGFADEVADDLETQLETFDALGIGHVDLRSVDGTNVVDFTDDDVAWIRKRLEEYGVSVAAIGSPIGKIDITDDFAPHQEDFDRILELADAFDADYVRLFSYWIPEDDDPAEYREEVLRRTRWKAERAEEAGIPIYHENEKDIYGDTPARCRDLVEAVDSPAFGLIFDPANFLEVGVRPYPDALVHLVEYVEALHIKDATHGVRGDIKPAGEGDGRIPEVMTALADRGFSGYAALEPHLAMADEMGGYSGPEAFEVATDALTDILDGQGLAYQ